MRKCLHCNEILKGRSDKRFCTAHCRSAYAYHLNRSQNQDYYRIDRQLKINRKILKKLNAFGKSVVRCSSLHDLGFDPNYFTHYWKNTTGRQSTFSATSSDFKAIRQKEIAKYLLVKWQSYMKKPGPT